MHACENTAERFARGRDVKETFKKFIDCGSAMTKEELATILKVSPDYVRRNSQPPDGFIPRIPYLRQLRFDPEQMLRVFCEPKSTERPSSLTTEERNIQRKSKGRFSRCL